MAAGEAETSSAGERLVEEYSAETHSGDQPGMPVVPGLQTRVESWRGVFAEGNRKKPFTGSFKGAIQSLFKYKR